MGNSESECLTEGCNCKPIARGVCKTCYYRLLRHVQRNGVRWGDLISRGLCKPAHRYKGLTAAVRRKNALIAIDYNNSTRDNVERN